ncbi:DUF1566 domain-containing protein [Janthinobacterium sp. PAMC25594]|uniref:DUF1566 domain-containing protein n=1 Tax=Janthinobacterium sp. PAMC25594 TaxID=2861284 RepID=UPI001C63380C|nr:DUF1566 domain-containing protein [Janthinobacterium sp. PAMC25594]QYG07154.1 DUF1566 domain-containing protein [Janthinobacterium sp. PAMC25594]
MSKQQFMAENLQEGEIYAGLILGKDGAADYHLFLQAGEAVDVTWQAAVDWAKKLGHSLPTRREQALLIANLKEQFQPRWYWSGEQYGPSSSYAWGQLFGYGYQDYDLKSYEGRARAVRRLEI